MEVGWAVGCSNKEDEEDWLQIYNVHHVTCVVQDILLLSHFFPSIALTLITLLKKNTYTHTKVMFTCGVVTTNICHLQLEGNH